MIVIPNTGERILLEVESPLMIARHVSAYRFAVPFAAGKSVLDIGCGQGYGTFLLAQSARAAVGIDYNRDAIAYAQETYRKNNASFRVVDVAGLSRLNERFGVVCAFQVIEHIAAADDFLRAVKLCMEEGAIFIVSTPNRLDASPCSSTPHNKFHVKEYLCDEFKSFLQGYFRHVTMWGLKRTMRLNFYRRLKKTGLCRALPRRINPVERYFAGVTCNAFATTQDALQSALDFLAVCKD